MRLLEQVRTEASNLRWADALLTALAFPFLLLGAVLGGLARFLWVLVSWVYASVVVGFRKGRGT